MFNSQEPSLVKVIAFVKKRKRKRKNSAKYIRKINFNSKTTRMETECTSKFITHDLHTLCLLYIYEYLYIITPIYIYISVNGSLKR